jgi:hypothetical protein
MRNVAHDCNGFLRFVGGSSKGDMIGEQNETGSGGIWRAYRSSGFRVGSGAWRQPKNGRMAGRMKPTVRRCMAPMGKSRRRDSREVKPSVWRTMRRNWLTKAFRKRWNSGQHALMVIAAMSP